jgi:WD40 repeat protein
MIDGYLLNSDNETRVECLAISPDERFLAIGQQGISKEKANLTIWDTRTRNQIKALEKEDNYHFIKGLAFIKNGNWLIYSKDDGALWKYDLDKDIKNELSTISPYTKGINSPDSERYISTFGLQQVIFDFEINDLIWWNDFGFNVELMAPVQVARELDVFAFFDPRSKLVNIASFETKEVLYSLQTPFEKAKELCFSADGKYLAILNYFGDELILFSIKNKEEFPLLDLLGGYMPRNMSIAFCPGSPLFFLGTLGGGLICVNLEEKIAVDYDVSEYDITRMLFSNNGEHIFIGSNNGVVKIIDVKELGLN